MIRCWSALSAAALAVSPSLASAQSGPDAPTLRAELSVGAGPVGSEVGYGARVSLQYYPARWGFSLRQAGHLAGRGPTECTGTRCVRRQRWFLDTGLLLNMMLLRERSLRVSAGAGVARLLGREAVPAPGGSLRLDTFASFSVPLEVGIYTAGASPLGVGVVLMANMNSRVSQMGLFATVSLGRWR